MSPEQLLTDVREYAHADRLGRVTLVGMSHIAQPGYFSEVKTLIDTHTTCGGVVHYESVHEPMPEELASATPRERIKSRGLTRALRRFSKVTEGLVGLVHQSDMIPASPDWHCPDISHLDLARLLDDQTVIDVATEARYTHAGVRIGRAVNLSLGGSIEEYSLQFAQMLVADNTGPRDTGNGPVSASLRMARETEPVRNQRQLAAIDAHAGSLPDVDLLATWGDDHLEAIGAGLLDRGYTQTSRSQLVAVDLWDLEAGLGVVAPDPFGGY